MKCKSKSSLDCDIIFIYIIQQTMQYIIEPLTYIFSLSFKSGIFPVKMKQANIILIYKKVEITELSNYRPISLL